MKSFVLNIKLIKYIIGFRFCNEISSLFQGKVIAVANNAGFFSGEI